MTAIFFKLSGKYSIYTHNTHCNNCAAGGGLGSVKTRSDFVLLVGLLDIN